MTTPTLAPWEVREWLIARIAEALRSEPRDVSTETPLSELGLSSVQSVELATALEDWCGHEIPVTFVYDCPTIDDAAAYVLGLPPLAPVPGAAARRAEILSPGAATAGEE